jgi:predicted RNA-binding protein associated with RNAse of E/G family
LTLKNIAFRGKHYDIIVSRDANGNATLARTQR